MIHNRLVRTVGTIATLIGAAAMVLRISSGDPAKSDSSIAVLFHPIILVVLGAAILACTVIPGIQERKRLSPLPPPQADMPALKRATDYLIYGGIVFLGVLVLLAESVL